MAGYKDWLKPPAPPLPELTRYAVGEDLRRRDLLVGITSEEESAIVNFMYGGPGKGFYGLSVRKKMRSGEIAPPPTTSTISVSYAAEAEKQRRKRHKGYGSTILAGGELGVSAATRRKQILG